VSARPTVKNGACRSNLPVRVPLELYWYGLALITPFLLLYPHMMAESHNLGKPCRVHEPLLLSKYRIINFTKERGTKDRRTQVSPSTYTSPSVDNSVRLDA
jgi:hypothetical protein